jgi:hypothetical protein
MLPHSQPDKVVISKRKKPRVEAGIKRRFKKLRPDSPRREFI